jgi:hypothetical protein
MSAMGDLAEMQILSEAPQHSHAPLVGASADGEAALQKLLDECKAPDDLKRLSSTSQLKVRIAVRVVWPTFKPLTFGRQPGSSSSGGESSIFECRLVDVRGDSCLFRVYVDGEQGSKGVKDRGAALMSQFFESSTWVFSEVLRASRDSGGFGLLGEGGTLVGQSHEGAAAEVHARLEAVAVGLGTASRASSGGRPRRPCGPSRELPGRPVH